MLSGWPLKITVQSQYTICICQIPAQRSTFNKKVEYPDSQCIQQYIIQNNKNLNTFSSTFATPVHAGHPNKSGRPFNISALYYFIFTKDTVDIYKNDNTKIYLKILWCNKIPFFSIKHPRELYKSVMKDSHILHTISKQERCLESMV